MRKHSIFYFSLILALFSLILSNDTFGQISDTIKNNTQNFEHMTIVIKQFDGKISKIYLSKSDGYYLEINEIIQWKLEL